MGYRLPQGTEGGKREEDRKRRREREKEKEGGREGGREREISAPEPSSAAWGKHLEIEKERSFRVSEKRRSLCFPEIWGWVSLSGITLGT